MNITMDCIVVLIRFSLLKKLLDGELPDSTSLAIMLSPLDSTLLTFELGLDPCQLRLLGHQVQFVLLIWLERDIVVPPGVAGANWNAFKEAIAIIHGHLHDLVAHGWWSEVLPKEVVIAVGNRHDDL